MTQLNTPYPATAYLKGFLKTRAIDATQADPALELVLRLLSRDGLQRIRKSLDPRSSARSPAVSTFLANFMAYLTTVEPTIRFLQGKDPTLAARIESRKFLPEGNRFGAIATIAQAFDDPLTWAFGAIGVQDAAKYLASLYIDDLADVIRDGIDPRFALSRYGEKLAASEPTFEPLKQALEATPTLVDEMLDEIALELLNQYEPEVLALTAPFPGNVYGALRIARVARKWRPQTKILLGGGYPNTELRELQEPAIFDYVDFISLDDGEMPFLCLLDHLSGGRPATRLKRTFVRENGHVVYHDGAREHDIPSRDAGTPSYAGLPLDRYLSILEMPNPMHRLWSDGRWNKLTLAHGCYWKKCNFCDTTLDYIGRYDPVSADLIVDRIETMVRETGQTGFHFVDEAAPPALLRGMAERLIARGITITWWGNVRFEKTFTPELAELLARSGCIAVSGGLEVASDRLLKLMSKGVTVEQVARVTHAFTNAGVLVHAYLMYGFPTQTEAETVDALERVRQLFALGCIQSAYWHRFSATAHSPIGRAPAEFGIRLIPPKPGRFARNDLGFEDPTGTDHDALGVGLRKALYNYMHGVGLDADVREWFDFKVARAKVAPDLIEGALWAPRQVGLKKKISKPRQSASRKPRAR